MDVGIDRGKFDIKYLLRPILVVSKRLKLQLSEWGDHPVRISTDVTYIYNGRSRYEIVFDGTPLAGARRVRFGANGHPETVLRIA